MALQQNAEDRLLSALAEELKLPLVQIALNAELAGNAESKVSAQSALLLIDSYILGVNHANQQALQFEPVTLSSVLFDTANVLGPIAKQKGYKINMDIGGKFGPVMGHRQSLQYAFAVLGYELMGTPPQNVNSSITLAVRKAAGGFMAGVFSDNPLLSSASLKRARAMVGAARQTFPLGSSANGAGYFIADSLLASVAAQLKVTRHNSQTGVGVVLSPSQQLRLV